MPFSILIVEDESIVAADLAGRLQSLGYDIAGTAARGEKAVELAARLRPDLALMDISLAGPMDGIAAAEAIRGEHDIPIVYLTAHADAVTLARAKLTGPMGYLLKPFDERELATQIEIALFRHQADRQIRQQREWLRVTLASIGDAVIAADAAGRITFLNPVAETLTGWKAEEAAGRSAEEVFRVVDEQTAAPREGIVARVLSESRVLQLEDRAALLARDGRSVSIEDSAAPICDADGQVIGAVIVFRDVTAKRRAEEALKRAHDELEQRVAERTAELAEIVEELHIEMTERSRAERLLQREHRTLVRLIEARDRERQAISLGIHDNLAQPLTSATMHLQAAEGLKDENPEAAAEAQSAGIAMLRASINEARRLIDGVRPPILEDEGIEAAIAHLAAQNRGPDAPEIEICVDARFERLAPSLESTIYRIVQEGIDNAQKHSRSDRVAIELTQVGDRLHVEIRDWGVGFDPQAIGDESFGLEEIRERARLLGGTAAIESAPGRGTRICAELPVILPSDATTG